MGAICGLYKLEDNKQSHKGIKMLETLSMYNFDKSDFLDRGQIFFGCGVQINTVESKFEILPFYDSHAALAITADAIIDNRDELMDLLNLRAGSEVITDSQIILAAYMKWGNRCCEYLVGDFAFAIWDENNRRLFCARDHVGKRSLYYCMEDNVFMFCTVMRPILELISSGKTLNEKWISDFLTIEGVVHEIDIHETVYKNIYQVPPAHYITVTTEGYAVKRYWFPEKIKSLALKSDCEYIETFRNIFQLSVKCRLRSEGNVAIMLSGGLDSSSVAALSAIELGQKGKSLEAFTSVPILGYRDYLPQSLIADESEFIEELKKKYSNININYCRAEGKNSITDMDRFIETFEQPYKMIDNLFWIDDILSKAKDKGCKVLLDGQLGNFTISYGNYITHIYTLLKKCKFISVYREINGYSRFYRIERKLLFKKMFLRVIKSIKLLETFTVGKRKEEPVLAAVNSELSKAWKSKKRAQKLGYNVHKNKIYDFKEMRNFITNMVLFSHMGSLETKHSLSTGLIKRDPTRDKRVIEFCLSLPPSQFVSGGRERILIRRAMEGILPDKIRLNYRVRGKQSADWIQRMESEWVSTSAEITEMLQDDSIKKYLDVDKLDKLFKKVGEDLSKETFAYEVKTLLTALVFYKFLKLCD
ncbi:asparagine synthase-related protein [Clostridium thermarum]|uniref:asparagine synthase-related protein n=1 Tax=Clostridium thermarum TaxID=1716543 RepID=UPI0011239489|nr:asparagine synthase-related protein [Clostridium thermarum]